MPLVEALLSAFLGMLFTRLTSPEFLNFVQREGLGKKLDKWCKMLKTMEAVLDDADEKQYTKSAVKNWLDDLRDLAYDVDDVLDEFATEALRQKLTARNQASTSKVRKLIPACCTGFTPSAVKFKTKLRSEIEEITDRFDIMVKQKDVLELSAPDGRRSYRTTETTSVVTKAHVYGREQDKKALLDFLVGERRSDAQLSVLPIIGMGGIGKTTLAQLVYNDEEVQKIFKLKAWVCVSKDFDAFRVTKTILQSFTHENSCKNCEDESLSSLQEDLKTKLKEKKFLIVLDDVWNEKYIDWTILRAPFEAGASGSMILITTRNEEVSSKMGTIQAYNLKDLLNDDCLSILAHHALGTSDFSAHPNLKDIGERIVRRCKGSPLAAKVLGGILLNKVERDEWEKVLNSKIWELPQVESEIAPVLMLSYHHLPSNLKRCFAYCSILPKDYEFEEQKLVLLWMAEGLIQPQKEEEQMEDLGREYFRNLCSRSFFQQSFKDKSLFLMHDLINDLAQWVAGDICFKMEDRVGGNNGRKPFGKVRHSSYLRDRFDGIQKFEVFHRLTRLRTFLPFMLRDSNWWYLTSNLSYLTFDVPFKLLPKLRRLRVLSLNGYHIYELPKSIGDLKHLRFLDLSHTQIRSLPESVGTFYNLQTLILEECSSLKKLPSTFGNLVNLRHLNIRGANALEGMPQIGKLTCLQTLPHLIVRKGSCYGVKELGPLLHLRETLCISGLENVINHNNAKGAKLSEKQNLNGLSLEWSKDLDESQDRTSELEVLRMLQPHNGLKELTVSNYGGTGFPIWLRAPKFFNMVLLKIESCAKCTLLPELGKLPSLKDLFIKGMASVKNIGREFYGESCSQPFKSLETLHFEDMQEWENWILCEQFPKLRKLSITLCPKLICKLPNQLPLLENIVIDGCTQLVVSISSFPELCKLEIEGSKGVVRGNKVDFNSLTFSLPSTILEFPCRIEEFILAGLTNVEDLKIQNCAELTTLSNDVETTLSNHVELLQLLPCLGVLNICDYSKLVSSVAAEVEEQLQQSLPLKVRRIMIRRCEVLKSLPKAMMHYSTCLEEICISGCHSLTHFAIGQLPPTLKRLEIEDCQKMKILVYGNDIHSSRSLLEYLYIVNCPSLKYLTTSGELPATLKHLQIEECNKLKLIANSFRHNSSLEAIEIFKCDNLKSLSRSLPTNLRALVISECEKMQALPNCIHNLNSLQELEIGGLQSILSFAEGGFPINLTSLSINIDESINEAIFAEGLYNLTSLKELVIHGGLLDLVSFPEITLPPSLTCLSIKDFLNLECMPSESFQFPASLEELSIEWCANLTSFSGDGLPLSLRMLSICYCEKLTSFLEDGLPPSLKRLSISDCEKLTSFPKFGLSPSLMFLNIGSCEKLTSFPGDVLPLSLLQLDISSCPQLIERCKGREWFKIAHIPSVRIDHTSFYKPEEECQWLRVLFRCNSSFKK